MNRLHVNSGNSSPERRTYGSNVHQLHGNRGVRSREQEISQNWSGACTETRNFNLHLPDVRYPPPSHYCDTMIEENQLQERDGFNVNPTLN